MAVSRKKRLMSKTIIIGLAIVFAVVVLTTTAVIIGSR
jgi:hypothetical protein